MNSLPLELLFMIWDELPLTDFMRLRLVDKEWHELFWAYRDERIRKVTRRTETHEDDGVILGTVLVDGDYIIKHGLFQYFTRNQLERTTKFRLGKKHGLETHIHNERINQITHWEDGVIKRIEFFKRDGHRHSVHDFENMEIVSFTTDGRVSFRMPIAHRPEPEN